MALPYEESLRKMKDRIAQTGTRLRNLEVIFSRQNLIDILGEVEGEQVWQAATDKYNLAIRGYNVYQAMKSLEEMRSADYGERKVHFASLIDYIEGLETKVAKYEEERQK